MSADPTDAEVVEDLIDAHNRQPVREALSDEHPVERIAMVAGGEANEASDQSHWFGSFHFSGEWRVKLTYAARIDGADFCLLRPGFGFDSAIHYGRIMAAARASGRPMSVPDGQIAAVALEHGFELATRNTRDFAMTNLQLIDPWTT